MKTTAILTIAYALIVIAGGVIGYIKAGSTASIAMGFTFGLLLLITAVGMIRGSATACTIAACLAATLTLFFAYRLFATAAFMPAGLMALISLAALAMLITQTKAPTVAPVKIVKKD